jgi:hypothetical protein
MQVHPFIMAVLTHKAKYMFLPVSGINDQSGEAVWPKLAKGWFGSVFLHR